MKCVSFTLNGTEHSNAACYMEEKRGNMAEYLMNEPHSAQSRDNLTLLHVQSARGSLSVTQA